MSRNRIGASCVAVLAALPAVAFADFAGTGPAASECYVTLGRVAAPSSKNILSCQDGDPACDADATVDNQCTFAVDLCAHQDGIAGCTSPDISTIKFSVKGKPNTYSVTAPGTLTEPVTTAQCGTTGSIVVKVGEKKKKGAITKVPSKQITVTFSGKGSTKPKLDKDRLRLVCSPAPPACPANSSGGISELRFRIKKDGQDLDIGWTGDSHNQLNVFGAEYTACMTGCDASGTTDCTEDQAATDAVNGTDYGPPLPLLTGTTATCVRQKYGDPKISGATANMSTGKVGLTVNLLSQVYLTNATQVCPECSSTTLGGIGSCKGLPGYTGAGRTCKTEGLVQVGGRIYSLSTACLPDGNQLATITIPLGLTTEASAKSGTGTALCPGLTHSNACGAGNTDGACTKTTGCGPAGDNKDLKLGIYEHCCDSNPLKSCFPIEATQASPGISVTGAVSPVVAADAGSDFPKKSTPTLAAAFCISATGNVIVDSVAGLPGPGTTVMPVDVCWLKGDSDPSKCPAPEVTSITPQ